MPRGKWKDKEKQIEHSKRNLGKYILGVKGKENPFFGKKHSLKIKSSNNS